VIGLAGCIAGSIFILYFKQGWYGIALGREDDRLAMIPIQIVLKN
jgi:hypothetical protein